MSTQTIETEGSTNRVKAVPDGYHTLTPHLVVKGASEAVEFYKKAFGAEEIGRVPGPDGKTLMHAELKIGDSRLLTSSPKTGPEKFEFSGGRSSPKKEENRDEKETQ